MADRTRRYSLLTLGSGDELSTNGYEFTAGNRVLLDQLLTYAVEQHRHTGFVPTATPMPTSEFTVTVNSTGGVFPAGKTVFYRLAAIDSTGQFVAVSEQISVATPNPLSEPDPVALAASTTGTLPPGNYLYVVTAFTNSTGTETLSSRPATGALPTYGGWTLTLPSAPEDATGFNIYRKGPAEDEAVFLAAVAADLQTYIDDGSVNVNPYRATPNVDTSNATSSVTFDVTTPPGGYSWKLYRTTDQSTWADSFVTWTAVLPITDTGHASQSGEPPALTSAVAGAPIIQLETETQGVLPPAGLQTHAMVTFAFMGPVQPGYSPFQWVCDFDHATIVSARASLGRGSMPANQDVRLQLWRLRPADEEGWTWLAIWEDDNAFGVPVGDTIGPLIPVPFWAYGPDTLLQSGDALRLVVTQTGGGATPTDFDLSVAINLVVECDSTASLRST